MTPPLRARAPSLRHRRGALSFAELPAVVGVLNVTPDSFSDGGRWESAAHAVEGALAMVAAGARVIDVGGESTRPGAAQVSADEECARVVPVVRSLRAASDVVISIDTTKVAVAEAALEAGADIVNDVSGFSFEPAMAARVAESGAGCILMHTPARSDAMGAFEGAFDVSPAVGDALQRSMQAAADAGIAADAIAVDPGFGFGKNAAQNFALLARLEVLPEAPWMVGVSRKRMIRETVGNDPLAIEHGNSAIHSWAVLQGCALLRVHDVRAAVACVHATERLRRALQARSERAAGTAL